MTSCGYSANCFLSIFFYWKMLRLRSETMLMRDNVLNAEPCLSCFEICILWKLKQWHRMVVYHFSREANRSSDWLDICGNTLGFLELVISAFRGAHIRSGPLVRQEPIWPCAPWTQSVQSTWSWLKESSDFVSYTRIFFWPYHIIVSWFVSHALLHALCYPCALVTRD